jgi:polar amino acid transport system substrate-binding protein
MREQPPQLRVKISCFRLAIAGALLFGFAGSALALEPGRDYGCTTPIKVGVFEFGAWYAGGKGATVDLLNAITEYSRCRFEFVELPRSDVWIAMSRGEIDIVPSSIRTEERDKLAHFVTFVSIRHLAIVRGDTEQVPQSLDAFLASRSGTVALIDGFLYGSYFDFRLQGLLGDDRIVAVANPATLFDLLRSGAVELVLAPSVHYFYYVSEMERQSLFKVLDTTQAVPPDSGLALSRGRFSGPQADNWMRMIEHLLVNHTIRDILGQHLPPRVANSLVTK